MLNGTQLGHYVIHVVFNINADNFCSRHHDVVYGDVAEVEYTKHHVLVVPGNLRPFIHHRSQFIHAKVIFTGIVLTDTK